MYSTVGPVRDVNTSYASTIQTDPTSPNQATTNTAPSKHSSTTHRRHSTYNQPTVSSRYHQSPHKPINVQLNLLTLRHSELVQQYSILPIDIMLYVCSFMGCADLIKIATINKQFYQLSHNHQLWNNTIQFVSNPHHSHTAQNSSITPRQQYINDTLLDRSCQMATDIQQYQFNQFKNVHLLMKQLKFQSDLIINQSNKIDVLTSTHKIFPHTISYKYWINGVSKLQQIKSITIHTSCAYINQQSTPLCALNTKKEGQLMEFDAIHLDTSPYGISLFHRAIKLNNIQLISLSIFVYGNNVYTDDIAYIIVDISFHILLQSLSIPNIPRTQFTSAPDNQPVYGLHSITTHVTLRTNGRILWSHMFDRCGMASYRNTEHEYMLMNIYQEPAVISGRTKKRPDNNMKFINRLQLPVKTDLFTNVLIPNVLYIDITLIDSDHIVLYQLIQPINCLRIDDSNQYIAQKTDVNIDSTQIGVHTPDFSIDTDQYVKYRLSCADHTNSIGIMDLTHYITTNNNIINNIALLVPTQYIDQCYNTHYTTISNYKHTETESINVAHNQNIFVSQRRKSALLRR